MTRLRLDAAFYNPASEGRAGTNERPCLHGACQPGLQCRLADPKSVWEQLTVAWNGEQQRMGEVAGGTAV